MVNVNTFNFNEKGQLLITDINTRNGNVVPVHEYEEVSIPSGSTNTVVTYTVPSDKVLVVTHFHFGGNADGILTVEVNSANEYTLRNSAAIRDNFRDIDLEVDEGLVINLNVENCGSSLQSFEAVLHGKLVDKNG